MLRKPHLILAALLASVLVPVTQAQAAQYADTAAVERRSPAVAAAADGSLDVFSLGAGGDLQQQHRDAAGRWSGTASRGGALTSKPAAASMSPGRVDVFARGSQGQLLQRYVADGRWSPWASLGGRLQGAPSVVSWGARRLDVFVLGTDSALWHKSFDGSRWSGWQRIGGQLASAPAAVTTGPGRLDVFARGTDGQLQHVFYPGGAWSVFSSLGGDLRSEPAASSPGGGRLDVLFRGSDGALQHMTFAPDQGWTGAGPAVGAMSSGPGSAALPNGELLAAARDGAGRLVLRTLPHGGDWTPWAGVTGRSAFDGLGAWVDLYDYAALDRDRSLDDLQRQGVRTLYLQTSRFSSSFDTAPQAAGWVDAAHARGLAVVGWYLPGYGNMDRDVRRTLAVAQLRTPAGGAFDAIGVDIEAHTGIGRSNEVDRPTMNRRAVEHLRAVRARTAVPLAAITPQPTATDGRGETWEGFPWQGVGETSDVVLPMSYWPGSCREACVRDYTATNARYAASWTGLPVHMAGRGYTNSGGSPVTDRDVTAFVDGARAAYVTGGSLYDYASTRTRTAWWPDQRRLNG